jgi:hypothetical protein
MLQEKEKLFQCGRLQGERCKRSESVERRYFSREEENFIFVDGG